MSITEGFEDKHKRNNGPYGTYRAHDVKQLLAHARQLEACNKELVEALNYAKSGFDLAYDAEVKGLHDEALLHCGHHGARLAKLIGGNE